MHFPVTVLPVLLLLLAANPILANPDGAPACVINETRIRGMGGSNQDLGYSLRTPRTYRPGQAIDIELAGPADYKGLLLYVEPVSNDKLRVGNFDIPSGFQSSKSKCDNQGFTAGPRSVLTHSDASRKRVGTRFRWAPDGRKCEDVVVRAVVAKEKTEWQILQPVTLTCGGDGQPKQPVQYDAPRPTPTYNEEPVPAYGDEQDSYRPWQGDDGSDYAPDYESNRRPVYGDVSPSAYGRPDESCDEDDVEAIYPRPQGKPRHPRPLGTMERPWGRAPRYMERVDEYEPVYFSARPIRHRRQCRRRRTTCRRNRHGRRRDHRKAPSAYPTKPTGTEVSAGVKPSTAYPQTQVSTESQSSSAYPQADTSAAKPDNQTSAYPQSKPTAYPVASPPSSVSQNSESAYPAAQPSTAYPAAEPAKETTSAYPSTQSLNSVATSQSTKTATSPATHEAQPVYSAYMMAAPNGDSAYFEQGSSEDDAY